MDLLSAREQQLVEKIRMMKTMKLSQEEIIKSFDKDELDLVKRAVVINHIEKGTKANIGEIREWSGKKYKKQPNGKWVEVSESHGLNKRDHEDEAKSKRVIAWNTKDDEYRKKFSDESKLNEEAASKLSDKEHSDEEVGLKQKKN